MSRRVLIIEPDASGRSMMDRVLTSEGLSAETGASVHEARALLDAGVVEVVIIDELAGAQKALDEVRWLRSRYPTVPVIVTGALLSRREMQELLRLRVADALAKPFTPVELREAVARAIEHRATNADALEYDAALTDARRAIAAGLGRRARAPLARAQAMSPVDAEIMALWALIAELDGEDTTADHASRAALALRDEEAGPPPDPHEGLARLAAYAAGVGARPVTALRPERAAEPLWLISDPATELRGEAPVQGPHVAVMALGLIAGAPFQDGSAPILGDARERPPTGAPAQLFLRDGEGPRAFALLAGSLRAESAASAAAALGAGPLVAGEATRPRLDLDRVAELRRSPAPAPGPGRGITR